MTDALTLALERARRLKCVVGAPAVQAYGRMRADVRGADGVEAFAYGATYAAAIEGALDRVESLRAARGEA